MCKLLAVTGARDRASAFIRAAQPLMCANDRDGFGYVAVNKGGIGGERWLNPNDAWDRPIPATLAASVDGAAAPIKNVIGIGRRALRRPTAIVAHARMATTAVSLMNVHPFASGNTYLAHNGIVSGPHTVGLQCDSVALLDRYTAIGVGADPDLIGQAMQDIYGWYAVIALHVPQGGGPVVDIWKEGTSRLSVSIVDRVGTVWATSADHVRGAARKIGVRVRGTWTVASGMLTRIDAVTGAVIARAEFKPETRTAPMTLGFDQKSQYAQWWEEEGFAPTMSTKAQRKAQRKLGRGRNGQEQVIEDADTTYKVRFVGEGVTCGKK